MSLTVFARKIADPVHLLAEFTFQLRVNITFFIYAQVIHLKKFALYGIVHNNIFTKGSILLQLSGRISRDLIDKLLRIGADFVIYGLFMLAIGIECHENDGEKGSYQKRDQ
ncbi:hypothetical protein [Paenibacillus aceti]|uniref:hypothetical protein n=1 Tax=Paenibacillus aceti TaxID=1820010 RepID=UPI0013C4A120|nr:hypothetical protein [Paenibacillus aceti]